ncbi:hypothetical protein SY83_16775 [Paenibacillus swuensis]|uniref:DUF2339 domain-containing protein n=1 Tax=Paenibacillus swuensis TaxID=1178515 RepID=A0A172TLK9_9BACL|nr:DUF2339 domain-containing protein [Paenibacillus swuensis]ANE47663.1 hypothetical protein SY83_16775 [Paenibacillus swuensis]
MEDLSRIQRLEERVAQLEQEIRSMKEGMHFPPPQAEPSVATTPPERSGTSPVYRPAAPKKIDWEHLIAKVWLPRIFMFVLLIGVVWGFKAAVDGGLLTEELRCVIGFAAGGLLLFAGFRQQKKQRGLLAQVLMGGSVALFMLTTFAAHYWYGFINTPVSFFIHLVWVALALVLSYRSQSQFLAVFAVFAGVLTPFLVKSTSPSPIFFTIYESLLFIAFLIYASVRRMPVLFYTTFALSHLAYIFFQLSVGFEEITTLGIIVQQLVLTLLAFVYLPFSKPQLQVLLTGFGLSALWSVGSYEPANFSWIMLASAALYGGFAIWFKRKSDTKLPYATSLTLYALVFFCLKSADGDTLPTLLLLEGFIGLVLGFYMKSSLQKLASFVIYIGGGLAAYAQLIDGMDTVFSWNLLTWLVGLSTLYGLRTLLLKDTEKQSFLADVTKVLSFGIGLLGLVFLTDLTLAVLADFNSNVKYLSVSAVWVGYAAAFIAYGVIKDVKKFRLAGLALLFLTLGKIVFFDLPSVSVLIRAVLFIGFGGIGILISRFIYSRKSS